MAQRGARGLCLPRVMVGGMCEAPWQTPPSCGGNRPVPRCCTMGCAGTRARMPHDCAHNTKRQRHAAGPHAVCSHVRHAEHARTRGSSRA